LQDTVDVTTALLVDYRDCKRALDIALDALSDR
jgi:hypothetical protein